MKRFLLANKNYLNGNILSAETQNSVSFFLSFKSPSKILFTGIAALVCINIHAQQKNINQPEADYKKVITERSAKIVNTLGLTDSDKYNKALNEIVNQYSRLNAIHGQNKIAIAEIKKQSLEKSEMEEAIKKLEEKKSSALLQLHGDFIAYLKKNLSADQLEKIKDGMTYRVFPVTYTAYQDMLPNLTTQQKEKIYAWLKDARELAMDEGSSEDKHKVFGKYKGRINNYLSRAGYDMKKEGEEWQKRIKEKEAAKKGTDSQ
jgi:iron-sulfur cluster repair protein YtfE (RIC family)